MQGDGAMRLLMGQLTLAREMAVTQRRNMEIKFVGTNWVQIIRHEVPGPATTTLASVVFEGNVEYQLLPGVVDTPDNLARATACRLRPTQTLTFNSDGTLVDDTGNPINGTIFLAVANVKQSQRAVTVMGSTGRVRGYKWNGLRLEQGVGHENAYRRGFLAD